MPVWLFLSLFSTAGAPAGPPPDAALPSIVFVSRLPLRNGDPHAVPGMLPRYRTASAGGRLMLRREDGALTTIVGQDRLADVADPCVSWDGTRIIFSGLAHADSSWRIFEVGADGSGLRAVTRTDRAVSLEQFGAAAAAFVRYDDIDPCYLPDGRILFASTRYPARAMTRDVLCTNLFVMEPDGSGLRRITSERNSGEEPSVDPVTGQVVFARWWVNVDLPSNRTRTGLTREAALALDEDIADVWQAIRMTPDGDEIRLYAGAPRTRAGVHVYKPAILSDGRLLGTFTPLSARGEAGGGFGIRAFDPGPSHPRRILGGSPDLPASPPFALEAVPLGATEMLLAYSADGVNFGVARAALDGSGLITIVDLPGSLELEPQPLVARTLPPVLRPEFTYRPRELPPTEDPATHAQDDFFRFDCMNIFANAGVDVPIPDAPRITRNARIRFFMNVQRRNPHGPDPSILLKDAEVMYHGGVHEHDVPAEVPLFEQVVDAGGRVLATTDGRFAHVAGFNYERQGAGTKCVGCHAGHSLMDVPINGSMAEWFNLAPSARVTAGSFLSLPSGRSFHAERAVDRRARSGGDTAAWITDRLSEVKLRLTWEMPVEIRRVVLYAPGAGVGLPLAPASGADLVLLFDGERRRTTPYRGPVSAGGTAVDMPATIVDAVEVVVNVPRGSAKAGWVAGLAEVEVIGRLLPNDRVGARRP
jgi:hypothetical protein